MVLAPRPEDLDFILHDMLRVEELAEYPRFEEHGRETFEAVLETARRIAEDKFQPHNRAADLAEPKLVDGKVEIIPEIGQAIEAFNQAGFSAAHHDEALGGMQLPWTVVQAAFVHFQAANLSTAAYPFLSIAAANLIRAQGTDAQKARYLGPLLKGRYFGTMVLSEPHAGSSLSDVRTTAKPDGNQGYRLTGSKMWISGGEHEMAENILHLVLARIEGAPAGVKGLSLFLVPRIREDGALNDVRLVGLNHKMGYRGTVNTALAFGDGGDCHGELIGEANEGLAYMFGMMNEARIGVGLGAIMLAYQGYLTSLDYARERPQGRHPGEKDPDAPQVMLIGHADIRRMLLKQKAVAEGGLALGLWLARLVDRHGQDPSERERIEAGLLLDIVTPIIKAFFSDQALAANDAAIQIMGGAGYTRDHPVEQYWRDNRLNPIHEGANGIQAIDLLGRKATMRDGAAFGLLVREIEAETVTARQAPMLEDLSDQLSSALNRVRHVTSVLTSAQLGPMKMLANASEYMEMMGHLVLAWIWLRQASAAVEGLRGEDGGHVGDREDFLKGKLHTCRYVFARELPKISPLADTLEHFDMTTFDMDTEWF
jgi:alkylation response protein AidB-like acyl-CoA dehydrogenase